MHNFGVSVSNECCMEVSISILSAALLFLKGPSSTDDLLFQERPHNLLFENASSSLIIYLRGVESPDCSMAFDF